MLAQTLKNSPKIAVFLENLGVKIALFFIATIAFVRIVSTSWSFGEMKEQAISVRFQFPLAILGVVFLAVFIVLFSTFLQKNKGKSQTITKILQIIPFFEVVFFQLFSWSHFTGDSAWIIGAVERKTDEYMQVFPFQSGFWLYERIVYLLCFQNEIATVIILSILNSFMIAMAFILLFKVAKMIIPAFNQCETIFLLFTIFAIPILNFSWYLYSLIPFAFSMVLTIYFFLLYNFSDPFSKKQLSNNSKKLLFLKLLASLVFCYIIKPNGLLVVIVISLLQFMIILKSKKFRQTVLVLILVLTPFVADKIPSFLYEKTYNTTLGRGTPITMQIALGLDFENKANIPGWYDPEIYYLDAKWEKNRDLLKIQHPFDENAVHALNEYYKKDIVNSLSHFAKDPAMTARFFAVKFASTWASADFGADTYRSPIPKDIERSWLTAFTDWTFSSSGRWIIYCFDNIWGEMIAVFALIGAALQVKNKKSDRIKTLLLFGLVAIGALFHLISETKGMYSLPYFALLIPFAAVGLQKSYEKVYQRLKLK